MHGQQNITFVVLQVKWCCSERVRDPGSGMRLPLVTLLPVILLAVTTSTFPQPSGEC